MRSTLGFPALLVLFAACSNPPPPAAPTPVPTQAAPRPPVAAQHTPPKLRLPVTVVPKSYAVMMRMSPKVEQFTGSVDVDIDVKNPSDVVWLHAGDTLAVTAAKIDGAAAHIEKAGEDFLGISLDQPVAPGAHKMSLVYEGKLPAREGRGAYRQEELGEWYVFTQFESLSARFAYPCFDEPGFKTPWQITIQAPKDQAVFANTPASGEKLEADGWKTVTFAPTKPLPSYLTAFAVGPIEVVDGGKAGEKQTPVRILVPKGRSADAKYAAQITGDIMARIEKYTGVAYPFEKVDHIAVPMKGGAMENPGLITFGTNTMLSSSAERSIRLERGYPSIGAHELAHIWFGDYITTAWWDDIWLNEAFATWMASKIVDQMHPEWDGKVSRVSSKDGAMYTDSLVSTRRIRQPIESKHDVYNAFDGITYQKGAAVITMMEAFVGDDAFRAGVHDYLGKHPYGNATANEFLGEVGASLEQHGNPNAKAFAPSFTSFLDQPGVPAVTAELSCSKTGKPKLLLSQQRYFPVGSSGTNDSTWKIPVCASYPGGKSCTVLSDREGELVLDTKTCPAWVNADAGGAGYYRVEYKGDLLGKLVANKALSTAERVDTVGDAIAAVRANHLPADKLVAELAPLTKENDRHVVGIVAGFVASLDKTFVNDETRPAYTKLVAKLFGDRAHQLGWKPKAKEDDSVALLRRQLVPLVARDAKDPLAVEARKLTDAWLKDRKAIDHDLVGSVVSTAARHGDKALWDKLRAEAKVTKDRTDRMTMIEALGMFDDPELTKQSFQLALSDELDPREGFEPLLMASQTSMKSAELAYAFVKENYEKITARMPRDWGAAMVGVAGYFCDAQHKADVEQFFGPRIAKANGGPRSLSQTVERIGLCQAYKEAQGANVANALKK